jgi:hypothetical protein
LHTKSPAVLVATRNSLKGGGGGVKLCTNDYLLLFRSEIECEGCELVECIELGNNCLKRISTDEVLDACREMLATVKNKRAVPAFC